MKLHKGHLPILSPIELQALFQQIDALNLPPAAAKHLKAMYEAAANPNNDHPAVILKTLTPDQQLNAQQTMDDVKATFASATSRGREALAAMSQAEWDKLVSEANPKA